MGKVKKPITDWLEMLPEPYRTKALKNVEQHSFNAENKEVETIEQALRDAFIWRDTVEGGEYWLNVSEAAKRGGFENV